MPDGYHAGKELGHSQRDEGHIGNQVFEVVDLEQNQTTDNSTPMLAIMWRRRDHSPSVQLGQK